MSKTPIPVEQYQKFKDATNDYNTNVKNVINHLAQQIGTANANNKILTLERDTYQKKYKEYSDKYKLLQTTNKNIINTFDTQLFDLTEKNINNLIKKAEIETSEKLKDRIEYLKSLE